MSKVKANHPTSSSPSLSLKTRFALWLRTTITNAAFRRDGTINRRLLSLTSVKSHANPNPINGVKTYDVIVDPARKLWFRVFAPTEQAQDDLSVIVFFHGGGFITLSPDMKYYDDICRRFAVQIPSVIVSVDYRLSPEHPYPAQYDDGFDVLKFLDGDYNGEKVLPENANVSACFVAGDSAGGNLAHHVAKRAAEFDFRQLKVIGLVAIQPFFGGEERTESEKRLVKPYLLTLKWTDWAWKAFMPQEDRDHEVINVSGPKAADISRLSKFPATIVFVGGLDVLQDWQRRYYEWLKKSGKEAYLVDYLNVFHGFYGISELPESAQLISEFKEFVDKQRHAYR